MKFGLGIYGSCWVFKFKNCTSLHCGQGESSLTCILVWSLELVEELKELDMKHLFALFPPTTPNCIIL